MRIFGTAAGLLGALVIVASCSAPAPEPIAPEPIYDKYGNQIIGGGGQQCRDGRQSYSPNDARAGLPICENSCQQGYAVTAARMECVPIQRGGDNDNNDRDPQRGTVAN